MARLAIIRRTHSPAIDELDYDYTPEPPGEYPTATEDLWADLGGPPTHEDEITDFAMDTLYGGGGGPEPAEQLRQAAQPAEPEYLGENPFGARQPGEPYTIIIPQEPAKTIDERIEQLNRDTAFGPGYTVTPEYEAKVRELNALKALRRSPEQVPLVPRAIGPGLAGAPIQIDIPRWAAPSGGPPPQFNLAPIRRR